MAMTEKSFLGVSNGGFHRVAYTQWGDAHSKRVCVCVHGLTRNGRDYDAFATEVQRQYRVVCPDIVGRGASDRLADPMGYDFPQYVNDMTALIARLGADQVDWVGTSMGGIIGMLMAALPNSPIRKLVLVDVGPYIPKEALQRLAGYVGMDPRFPDRATAEAYFRAVAASFGPLTDAQWAHLVEYGTEPDGEGAFKLRYDPAIAAKLREGAEKGEDVDGWPLYDAIRCPVLLLRGESSDLLLRETADEMARRGPKATVVEVADTGHAPMLMDAPTIETVRAWLVGEDAGAGM